LFNVPGRVLSNAWCQGPIEKLSFFGYWQGVSTSSMTRLLEGVSLD